MEPFGRDTEHQAMSGSTVFPLRLPHSIKKELSRTAKADGTSMNQFITLAVAEKLSALNAQSFFEKRRGKANMDAFDAIMSREGGEPPRPGDEMP